MVSTIISLRNNYEKFTEILPEELLDPDIEGELKDNKSKLQNVVDEDSDFIKQLITKSGMDLSLEKFDEADYLIRKTFPLRNEKLERKSEIINYLLGHWCMCKSILLFLGDRILRELQPVNNSFTNYNKLKPEQREKRIAFIDLTRSYQFFIGTAVNILDIIEEYDEYFNWTCEKLDPTYTYPKGQRFVSHIHGFELLQGAEELLLRGNVGRFTPAPLIRSAIEVIITRSVLDTDYNGKYKGKKIIVERNFELSDILNAADRLGIQVSFGADSVRRMYEWGSISVHRAWRMPHSEIWSALFFVSDLMRGVLVVKDMAKIDQTIDALLDELRAKKKIEIE